MARRRRAIIGGMAGGLALLVLTGCGDGIAIDRIGAESTGTTQSMATSAATVAAEENAYLAAARPVGALVSEATGTPDVDDSLLLYLGYAVCLQRTRSGATWSQIQRDAATLGGGPESATARASSVLIRAARANICG
jgi:hypothetical protein